MDRDILSFYARPTATVPAGRHAQSFVGLPDDVGGLVRIVQHLVVYDVAAADLYGFDVPPHRADEIHLRSTEEKLDAVLALDDRPLAVARPVPQRLVGRCHHYVLLLVSLLRSRGVPARARCGFGAYFNPPHFEDHWVCEYWNAAEERWALADPQLDEVWRATLGVDHDILDMPRDQFLVAGDAWIQCRRQEQDPDRFGVGFVDLHGLWYVAGNVVRDLAALNRVELLPWDVWGAQPQPDQWLDDDQLAFFDRLAALGRDPDSSFAELRELFDTDDRVRVPGQVFNSLRERPEPLRY
ncbi:transglutaminase domain-containing protein [Micromonospora yangpuensis]|uniref:Transglutaminase-like superfamily protein n=1 Tax=Micromonospora yangpuensis TaxID=683228 RepID=A0A1C6UPK3_9ACTN|nr:transglutaminase domain-containing protein [Micromonospora yangpuensis]GGM08289.1 hypothetical protein GCM10012279_28010 [Micromonospora yangpuensis]SCL55952.1 Transglutaminase-like superfamily protein [Micromonospora yangpuensis]